MFEDDQPAAHLVERRGPLLAHLRGGPRRLNLTGEGVEQRVAFRRREVRAIAFRKCCGNPVVFLDECPSGNLGRVRGEDELYAQRTHGIVQPLGRKACGGESSEAFLARPRLRRGLGLLLVRAASPNAVMLFGDIGQVEEVGERPGDGQRVLGRDALELRTQQARVFLVA